MFGALRKIGSFFVWAYVIIIVLGTIADIFFPEGEYADTMPDDAARDRGSNTDESVDAGVPDMGQGRPLPAPSPFDDQSIVEASAAKNWTTGTGFAVAGNTYWLTAKHVARGCDRLGIVNENGGVAVKARVVYIADNADVAILQTQGGPAPLGFDLDESDIKLGAQGFHVGYPQSKPGEVRSRLMGRELMITEGAWRGKENTLAWAETARSRGLEGTLGGLSGGPAFDARGNVIGITIAENPRRGRVITTDASSVIKALGAAGLSPDGASDGPLTSATFSAQAKRLRANLKVIQVICMVG